MSPENDAPQHNDDPADVIGAHRWRIDGGTVMYSAWCYCGWNEPLQNTRKSARQLHGEHVIAELKAAGFEILSPGERAEFGNLFEKVADEIDGAIETELGVAKGLPGLGDGLTRMTQRMSAFAGQEAGKELAGALEALAPGATKAAQTGFDLVNRTIARAEEAAQRAIEAEAELAQAQTGVQLGLNPDLPNAPQWVKQLLGQHDPLAAALDVIGRRKDIVTVQLPEPEYGPDGEGQFGWRTSVGDVTATPDEEGSWSIWDEDFQMTVDEARDHVGALLAAIARVDAAEGEAK